MRTVRLKIDWVLKKKMYFYLVLLLTTITFYFLRFHYGFIRRWYLSLKIPGPIALPIVGNGLLFLDRTPTGSKIRNRQNWNIFGKKIFAQQKWLTFNLRADRNNNNNKMPSTQLIGCPRCFFSLVKPLLWRS